MADEIKDEQGDGDADGGGLHKVDTVPPPAGEDDAYSAPTRIGPMGQEFVHDLMQQAERHTAELTRKSAEETNERPPVKPQHESEPPPSKAPVSAGGTPLPRFYEEEEDEEGATVLSPKAKPPAVPHRPTPLQVSNAPPPVPTQPPMQSPPAFAQLDAIGAVHPPPRQATPEGLPPLRRSPLFVVALVGFAVFVIGVAMFLLKLC